MGILLFCTYSGTCATSVEARKKTTKSTASAASLMTSPSSTSGVSAARTGSMDAVLGSYRPRPRTLTSEFKNNMFSCMIIDVLTTLTLRYVCPKCDPHSKQNYPNLKKLNRADHELIRKTFKAIKQNRHSQQFMEPVDQRENPKYYEIVKEPMGERPSQKSPY